MAVITCKNDNSHTQELTAEITETTTEATSTVSGQTVYTATVEWNGNIYTDTQIVVLPATGESDDGDDNSGTETTTEPDTSTGDTQTGDKDNPDTGTTDSPETGDDSNIALWVALMLAAGAGVTGTILYRRKKKYSR